MSDLYNNLWRVISVLNKYDLRFWTVARPDGVIEVVLNANDLFYWGTSDCEVITAADLPDLVKAFNDINDSGLDGGMFCDVLWMSRKRGMRPQGIVFSKYPIELQELIIQSAPARNIDLFNPYNEVGKYEYKSP